MRRFLILSFVALAAGILSGCGDPAPSIPLAPEQTLPDTSKMSAEEIQKLHAAGSAGGSDRAAPGGGAPAGRGSDTPADRQAGP